MKSNIVSLLALFICIPFLSFSQEYEMKNFEWEKNPVLKILSASEKDEPTVVLEDKRISEYVKGENSKYVQYYSRYRLVRINDQAQVDRFNRIYLPVSDPADLVSLKARTISATGKVIELGKADMKKVSEDNHEYLILALEGLSKDSEIEFFYSMKRNYDAFFSETLQSRVYVRHAEVKIICPENLVYEMRAYNGSVNKVDTIINSKRYLIINRDSIKPLDDEEDYATDEANLLRLEFKLIKNTEHSANRLFSWEDAGYRYYSMTHSEVKSAKKDVKRLVKKLKLDEGSDDEKILKLENYLKSQINIVPRQDNATIKEMLKNKYGSENTVISLYALVFDYLDINNQLVITTNRFEKKFDADFDSWNFLEKNLIYLPSVKKYIDPANYAFRLGIPPYQYTGNKALFIKKLNFYGQGAYSEVKEIKPSPIEMSYDNMNADVSFSPDMDEVNISLTKKYLGHSESNIRAGYFYANTEDRSEILKNLASSIIKDAKVSEEKISNADFTSSALTQPLELTANLVSNSLIERAGENKIFSVGEIIGPQTEMYETHARQNPIDIAFLHSYDRVINVKIPEGYKVKGLDKLKYDVMLEEDGKAYMGFTSSYKQDGNSITINVKEYYDRLTLPASQFEDFKKVINAAADFNKIKLVLVKS